jgi:hypothetical protein
MSASKKNTRKSGKAQKAVRHENGTVGSYITSAVTVMRAGPIPTPKAKDVKCPGCAMALLKGGRCAAHGDPRLAHMNKVAATGKERTLKGLSALSSKAQKKLDKKLRAEKRKADALARKNAKKAKREARAMLLSQRTKVVAAGGTPVARKPASDGKRAQTHALIIKVLAKKNPRREGSRLYTMFAALKTGMTVGAYMEKTGAIMAVVNKCVRKGWIKLVKEGK